MFIPFPLLGGAGMEGHTLMDNLVSFAEVRPGMCFLHEFPI